MLVVCNGAYKSGSSWLFHIVQELADFRFPQREYQNAEWRKVPSIAPDRLASFLEEGSFREHDFVAKQHFAEAEQRRLLSQTPGVFVLDIERDLRDVVVSAYYHHVRLGRFVGSFGDFYWIEGRLIADRVTRYHRVWQQESPKDVLCASYEALHADFGCEVGRIAGFLGLELPQERLERVRERTSLERIRERRKEAEGNRPRFYRKGQTGEWQTHLTAPMLHDLARTAALQRGAAGWHAAQAARHRAANRARLAAKDRARKRSRGGLSLVPRAGRAGRRLTLCPAPRSGASSPVRDSPSRPWYATAAWPRRQSGIGPAGMSGSVQRRGQPE